MTDPMPTNKHFKRLVRTPMQKTGEAYTAARARLLRKRTTRRAARAAPPAPAVAPADYAKLTGKSDAAIKAKTGCTWERWVKALDHAKADTWPHRQIAEYVHDKFGMSDWWAQMVTGGYERIKGIGAAGQRLDGTYEATKSKTFPVPLSRLYRACSDARQREKWLPSVALTVRSATRDRYLRIGWPDGTPVVLGFTRTSPKKSHVAVQHGKLPDRATAASMKAYWEDRLAALGQLLA